MKLGGDHCLIFFFYFLSHCGSSKALKLIFGANVLQYSFVTIFNQISRMAKAPTLVSPTITQMLLQQPLSAIICPVYFHVAIQML